MSDVVEFLRSAEPSYDLDDIEDRIEDARYDHPDLPIVRLALDAWKKADPVDAANEVQAILECDQQGLEELGRLGREPGAPVRVRGIVEALRMMERSQRTSAISILHELMIERCQAVIARALEASQTAGS